MNSGSYSTLLYQESILSLGKYKCINGTKRQQKIHCAKLSHVWRN